MLSRSFKPNNALGRGGRLGLGAVWLVLGCGSKFSANPSADSGGSSSGSGGGGASAGTGGTAGTPGTAGTAGSAGTGGKPATGCSCAAGSYCPEGTKTCSPCNDFSVLNFAAPEKLAAVSQSAAGNERFPRAASAGTDLFYRAGLDGKPSIWYAATPSSGVGRALFAALGADSGPLFAPNFSPPQNFFFDRVNAMTGVREIMYATWANGVLSDTPKPAITTINGGTGDFSVAIAADVRRAYWMRTSAKGADLVWAMFGSNATMPAVLNLDVQVSVGKKCARLGDDATPWVNAAGTLLLFRSESMDDSCQPSDSDAFDLFATPLGKDGLPLTPGTPLANLNSVGMSSETDPSLSQDSCTIYFASDGGKGDFDLYRAARN
ncbi:MAG TPA: hypothetical protein VHW01_28495 [Polyangiaceae bacterium]|jgi:hypothetical protein|nr:hypothetical protein [Polyangiaceae bacterium]